MFFLKKIFVTKFILQLKALLKLNNKKTSEYKKKNQLALKPLNLGQFGFVCPSCLQKPHFRLARWGAGASDPPLFVRFCFDVPAPAELEELFLSQELLLVLFVLLAGKTKF